MIDDKGNRSFPRSLYGGVHIVIKLRTLCKGSCNRGALRSKIFSGTLDLVKINHRSTAQIHV